MGVAFGFVLQISFNFSSIANLRYPANEEILSSLVDIPIEIAKK